MSLEYVGEEMPLIVHLLVVRYLVGKVSLYTGPCWYADTQTMRLIEQNILLTIEEHFLLEIANYRI